MGIFCSGQRWHFAKTTGLIFGGKNLEELAPAGEGTATNLIGGTCQITGEHDAFAGALDVRIRDGNRREQRLRIGMLWILEYFVDAAMLNESAQIHDGYSIGDVPNDGEVVRDEEVGQAQLGLEFIEKVNYTSLDGNVESRDRFIKHHNLGVSG